MKIIIPAEKLAAAVNKYLLPGAIRHVSEQQRLKQEGKSQ